MKYKPSILQKAKWKFQQVADHISNTLRPRQRWLTAKIPKSWCDKPELIELVLFEVLINFVEEEKGCKDAIFDWTEELKNGYVTQEYVDNVTATAAELMMAYNYIKTERPLLQKQFEAAMPNTTLLDLNDKIQIIYDGDYKEATAIETAIETKDRLVLETIIKHYKFLWT
jgi:hypothetical protein